MSEIVTNEITTETVKSESPSIEPVVRAEPKTYTKELRVSSILQGLLDEHKAQSLVIEALREELEYLEQNPSQYFQGRKEFLYHAYTQTLKECPEQLQFDVKVCF
jgi:hypothetical protein